MSDDLSAFTSQYGTDPNFKIGFLTKQGGRIKTWKRRVFVLDRRNKMLFYYKQQDAQQAKGVIHLNKYTVDDAEEDIRKPHSLKLSSEGSRTYFLVADDEGAKLSWKEALAATCSPDGAPVITNPRHAATAQFDNDTDGSDEEEDVTLGRKALMTAVPTASGFGFDERNASIRKPSVPIPRASVTTPAAQSPSRIAPARPAFPTAPMENTLVPPVRPAVSDATLAGQQIAQLGFNNEPTLIPPSTRPTHSDPYATMVSDVDVDYNATLFAASQSDRAANANATLFRPSTLDTNATLFASDPDATLIASDPNATLFASPLAKSQLARVVTIPHIRLTPARPGLPVIDVDLSPGTTLKFGRYSKDAPSDDPTFFGFDSRVVSRRHCEIWVVKEEFFVRDTRSQSGTFLNAMRLSLPGEESRPFCIKTGDNIQLGVDLRGSVDDTTRSISFRVELSFRNPGTGDHVPLSSPLTIAPSAPPAMIDLTQISYSMSYGSPRK